MRALGALTMGLWTRTREGVNTNGRVHHADEGVQNVEVRYTQRLAKVG